MKFEYDPVKSQSNKQKHGLDFKEAQLLWKDKNLLMFPLRFTDEERHACIGQIHGKIWTAHIITYRGSTTRIISVRRAHKDEEKAYGC